MRELGVGLGVRRDAVAVRFLTVRNDPVNELLNFSRRLWKDVLLSKFVQRTFFPLLVWRECRQLKGPCEVLIKHTVNTRHGRQHLCADGHHRGVRDALDFNVHCAALNVL